MVFFAFPEGACWKDERDTVEFTVRSANIRHGARPSALLPANPRSAADPGALPTSLAPPAGPLRACGRTEAATAALTDDGNVEITGRDLRERDHRRLAGEGPACAHEAVW